MAVVVTASAVPLASASSAGSLYSLLLLLSVQSDDADSVFSALLLLDVGPVADGKSIISVLGDTILSLSISRSAALFL
jgi:hypothetical protein